MNKQLEDLIYYYNPWIEDKSAWKSELRKKLPQHFIERDLQNEINQWPWPGKAHLLIGGRQVGKSSILWHYFQTSKVQPLYLNCEELLVREFCGSAGLFAKTIKEQHWQDMPLFFEEAQHLNEPGLFFKGLVDLKIQNPIYITGSSSYHLRAKTRESLAGRSVRAKLSPLMLNEIHQDTQKSSRQQRKNFDKMISFGGYPEVWSSEQPDRILSQLLEAFVVRDASDFFKIKNVSAFRQLLFLLAGQIGNLVNLSEWAAICNINRATLENYLDILTESHIIFSARPYHGGKRAELTQRPKYFFTDVGLRNVLIKNFDAVSQRIDSGALLENWVGAELYKSIEKNWVNSSLHFWRTKSGSEVDFVVVRPEGILGFEVKAADMRGPKLTKSIHSFIDAYAPKEFIIFNNSLEFENIIGDTRVRWLPFHMLPSLF